MPKLAHEVQEEHNPDCPRYAAQESARSCRDQCISGQRNTPLKFLASPRCNLARSAFRRLAQSSRGVPNVIERLDPSGSRPEPLPESFLDAGRPAVGALVPIFRRLV